MGDRFSASTLEATQLQFQFYRSAVKFDAFSVIKVAIYQSQEDANSDVNPVAEIFSEDITKTGIGLYSYIAPLITTEGTYFDKIYIVPVEGAQTISFVNSFSVHAFSGGVGGGIPLCSVFGKVSDAQGNPAVGEEICFTVNDIPSIEGTTMSGIIANSVTINADDNGSFSVPLIQGVTYRVHIRKIGYNSKIKIPVANSVNLWSLVNIPVISNPSNPSDPGSDPNW
jgi:hypothetical protein